MPAEAVFVRRKSVELLEIAEGRGYGRIQLVVVNIERTKAAACFSLIIAHCPIMVVASHQAHLSRDTRRQIIRLQKELLHDGHPSDFCER